MTPRPERAILLAPLVLAAAALTVWAYPRVPVPEHADASMAAVDTEGFATRININSATQAELEALPRIGPALAARIVEFREANGPFASVEALDDVKGIGPKTIEAIRDHVSHDSSE